MDYIMLNNTYPKTVSLDEHFTNLFSLLLCLHLGVYLLRAGVRPHATLVAAFLT